MEHMSSRTNVSELTRKNTHRVILVGLFLLLTSWIISLTASVVAERWLPPPSEDISQSILRDWAHGRLTYLYFLAALVLDLLVVFLCVVAFSTSVYRVRAVVLIIISGLSLTWHGMAVSVQLAMR